MWKKIAELSWHGVAYGSFLSAIINFLIVGTTLFFIVKAAKAASDFGKKYDEVEEENCTYTRRTSYRNPRFVERKIIFQSRVIKRDALAPLFLYLNFKLEIFYVCELLLICVYVLQKVFRRIHAYVILEESQL